MVLQIYCALKNFRVSYKSSCLVSENFSFRLELLCIDIVFANSMKPVCTFIEDYINVLCSKIFSCINGVFFDNT